MAGLDVIFAGSGEFGAPALRAIAGAHRVLLVVTQPDRPAGRGKAMSPTPIANLAAEMGLPVLKTADINAENLPAADVMVVVAFGQKIAPHVVDRPRLGSINLHASLLPKYRGAAPINWAVINGESVSGNSVIRLAQRIDSGDILGQSTVPILPLETAGELHDRLAVDGAALLLRVMDELATGQARPRPQNESEATSAPKLSRQAAHVDFSQPAARVACFIRGMYPWPACHVRLLAPDGCETDRVVLVRARPDGTTGAAPGFIDAAGCVGAGDGIGVEILEVQPEGKRPMSLAAYRNGHQWHEGMRVEAV